MSDTVRDVKQHFAKVFCAQPAVVAQAPGRVEILGNHTDYNEGFVLSAAIDRYISVAVDKNPDSSTIELASTQFDAPIRISIDDVEPQPKGSWINYPLGVYAMLKDAGCAVGAFRIAIAGNIPMGAGLSSSAALEVATGLALSQLFGFAVERETMAKICQRAEHEYCGAKCGLLDQYSVLFGKKNHLLYIDFRSLQYRTVPLPSADATLAITPSGVSHALVDGAYNERRAQCFAAADYFAKTDSSVRTLRDISMDTLIAAQESLEPGAFRRARHVVGEDERVQRGIAMLESGDMPGFGHLLYLSHESSRMNFENSCPELDTLVDIARSVKGVYGSRLSGGGFGGATLTVIPAGVRAEFETVMPQQYAARTGRKTAVHIAAIADGAAIAR
jgi:galactokinase